MFKITFRAVPDLNHLKRKSRNDLTKIEDGIFFTLMVIAFQVGKLRKRKLLFYFFSNDWLINNNGWWTNGFEQLILLKFNDLSFKKD